MSDDDTVTIDRGEYERLLGAERGWWAWFGGRTYPGTITSVLPCGVCHEPTEVVHPILKWQYERLPDTAWVRCERYACKRVAA